MILSFFKTGIVIVTLFLVFFQAENKNKTLIGCLIILFSLEIFSIYIDHKKNKPSFIFVHQKRHFADLIPSSVDFTFDYKNLGGREAKKITISLVTYLDGRLEKEDSFQKDIIVPHQSIYPRLGLSSNACNEVFKKKKRLRVKLIINHNEGVETKYLEFVVNPQGIKESKWKKIDKF